MSEYGFQSFPEFKTVQAYAAPGDYDILSEVMKAHQRSSIGNVTIKEYMARDYKVPADFRQFLYVGQVLQAEGVKVAMEGHRARMPYCMGSLFWQINDCWPVASWSSIDYYGRWKAQQYFARKSFARELVTSYVDGDAVKVNVVSDKLTDQSAILTLRVMDFRGAVLKSIQQPLTLKANNSALAFTAPVSDLFGSAAPEGVLMQASLTAGDDVLAEDILYFRPVKDLALPQVSPLDNGQKSRRCLRHRPVVAGAGEKPLPQLRRHRRCLQRQLFRPAAGQAHGRPLQAGARRERKDARKQSAADAYGAGGVNAARCRSASDVIDG